MKKLMTLLALFALAMPLSLSTGCDTGGEVEREGVNGEGFGETETGGTEIGEPEVGGE